LYAIDQLPAGINAFYYLKHGFDCSLPGDSIMRQVGLLCIVILLFVVTWAVIVPMEQRDNSARDTNGRLITTQKAYMHEQVRTPKKVTFQEVSEKSRDALTTTAAYMKQEKESLQSKMSITLQRVDHELARLRAEAERVKADDKSELNRRITDLQEAKASLLNLKADLHEPTQAAWKTLKANWNRLEVDINARMKTEDEKPAAQAAG
jgi:hypothetical protein